MNGDFNRTNAARRAALLLAGVSILAAPALAQQAAAPRSDQKSERKAERAAARAENRAVQQDQAGVPDADAQAGADIVVRGIRASLRASVGKKRNSDQIEDVIDAEDIGKLPDTNVAESLQRITGVQINRDLGEGSEIAVRGFSQNRIEINGQTQVGSGSDGSVSFDTIPSEAFSSLEVVKTPAASDVEGSIGATVKLNTRMPFDNKKLIVSAQGQGEYSDRARKWTPNGSVLVSDVWNTGIGEIGALFSATVKKRDLRQDFFDVRGWEAVNGFGRDLNGNGVAGDPVVRNADGIITDLGDGVYVPAQARTQIHEQRRELDAFTGALQWQPSDRLQFYFNGSYNHNTAKDIAYQSVASFNSAYQPDPVHGGFQIKPAYQQPDNAVIADDRTIQSAILGQIKNGKTTGVNFNLAAKSTPVTERVFTGQVGTKYDITDKLKMEAQYAFAHGHKVTDDLNTTSGVGGTDKPFYYFDFGSGTDIPTIIPLYETNPDGTPTTAVTDDNRIDLTSIGSYSLSSDAINHDSESNSDDAYKVDFDWDVDWGFFRTLEFGARLDKIEAKRHRLRSHDASGVDADGTLAGQSFDDLEAQYPGITTVLPYDDVLAGASGDYPTSWYSLNPEFLRKNLAQIESDQGLVLTPDDSWGFDASIKTQALYLQADYSFQLGSIPVYGNYGVRWVHTKQQASGNVPIGVQDDQSLQLFTGTKSYTDWLPSLNMVAKPGRRFYVRFGVAQAMARPTPLQLAPVLNISDSFDSATSGDPYLNPTRVTQVDLSLERYYGGVNLVSVALFYKHFQQRIEDGLRQGCHPIGTDNTEDTPGTDGCLVGQDLLRIDTPVNPGTATVKGVEVNWQQTLSFLPGPLKGLGFNVNYTFVDAPNGSISATGAELPVQDLSRHSFNLIGFYERYGITARIAYNWRSKFYDERSTTNEASIAKPYGQLDGSISYDINKKVSLTFDAVNILNTPEQRYQEIADRILAYRVNDTRFMVGIRIHN